MQKISLLQRLSIYADLRRHRQLAARRSLFYNKNTAAKVGVYIGGSFIVFYLMFLSVMFATMTSSAREAEKALMGMMAFFVIVDFFLRFVYQQTPAQMVKPYLLMPMPKKTLVESFLLSIIFSWTELTWQCMVTPFVIMTIIPRRGLWEGLVVIMATQLLFTLVSQFYLFCRTKINDSLVWWLLPIAVFGSWFIPSFTGGDNGFDHNMDMIAAVGTSLIRGPWTAVAWTVLIALNVGMLLLNRHNQLCHVMAEINRKDTVKISGKEHMEWLEKWGIVGEYIRLEMRLLWRNKHPRKTLLFSVVYCAVFGMLFSIGFNDEISFTQSDLICFCCFMIMSANFAQRMMRYEGNYIDFLMVHRENIYYLLLAKYYCYTALLVVPLLFGCVSIATGAWQWQAVIAYCLYTAGPLNLVFLHTAIINDQTMPLDAKLTTQTSNDFNYVTMLSSVAALALPFVIIMPMSAFLTPESGYVTLSVISIAAICVHRPVIKNIYRLMMKRKYSHMENFRASR